MGKVKKNLQNKVDQRLVMGPSPNSKNGIPATLFSILEASSTGAAISYSILSRATLKGELLFTTEEELWLVICTVAEYHGFKLRILARHNDLTEWTIANKITIPDLCNFINDVGAAGVQSTCTSIENK